MEPDLFSTLLHVTRTRLLRDYPAQIAAFLEVLSDEEIWWRPHEQANAVANLVLHLVGSNRYYLEQVIAGGDVGRDRAAEFAVRGGCSKTQLVDAWEQARRAAERVLDTIQPSQLARTTDRSGTPTTYAQVLLHVTHHNAAHMGQIVWITKLLHPGAFDDLWVKQASR